MDDGGGMPLDEVLEPFRAQMAVSCLTGRRAGPAAARNAGAARARGDLLAFTDDDCRPRPDWLRRLAAVPCGPARPRYRRQHRERPGLQSLRRHQPAGHRRGLRPEQRRHGRRPLLRVEQPRISRARLSRRGRVRRELQDLRGPRAVRPLGPLRTPAFMGARSDRRARQPAHARPLLAAAPRLRARRLPLPRDPVAPRRARAARAVLLRRAGTGRAAPAAARGRGHARAARRLASGEHRRLSPRVGRRGAVARASRRGGRHGPSRDLVRKDRRHRALALHARPHRRGARRPPAARLLHGRARPDRRPARGGGAGGPAGSTRTARSALARGARRHASARAPGGRSPPHALARRSRDGPGLAARAPRASTPSTRRARSGRTGSWPSSTACCGSRPGASSRPRRPWPRRSSAAAWTGSGSRWCRIR